MEGEGLRRERKDFVHWRSDLVHRCLCCRREEVLGMEVRRIYGDHGVYSSISHFLYNQVFSTSGVRGNTGEKNTY